VLELRNVSAGYNLRALFDVSLNVDAGERWRDRAEQRRKAPLLR
jgi:hypothetical protein